MYRFKPKITAQESSPKYFKKLSFKMRVMIHLKSLAVEQWLMVLCIVLLILHLRVPTGRFVKYSTQEDIYICDRNSSATVLTHAERRLPRCPLDPNTLPSYINVYRIIQEERLKSLEQNFRQYLNQSGFSYFKPAGCRSHFKVAILVPYRNREEHLKIFLQHMHTFLPLQNVEYSIYIIEQSEKHGFNRGKLFNIGFTEALKDKEYCCFIFHDVDLLPENPQNMYVCSNMPRHMCVAIDTFRYVLPYADIFGGVVAMRREQFQKINGFSNRFFGWGAEDDDLSLRITLNSLEITRWENSISRYTMLSHSKAEPNAQRFDLLARSQAMASRDGLSNLKYSLLKVQRHPLYTKLVVDVDP